MFSISKSIGDVSDGKEGRFFFVFRSGELVELGWYKACTSEDAGRGGCGDCEGGMLICRVIRSR